MVVPAINASMKKILFIIYIFLVIIEMQNQYQPFSLLLFHQIGGLMPKVFCIQPVAKPQTSRPMITTIRNNTQPRVLPDLVFLLLVGRGSFTVSTSFNSLDLIKRPAYLEVKVSISTWLKPTCSAINASLEPDWSYACTTTGNSSSRILMVLFFGE